MLKSLIQQQAQKMKGILLFKAPALHHWKTYLMPQSDRVPLGLAQGQLPTVKTEVPPQVAAISYVMVMPKQVAEKSSWGLYCPICKNEKEHEENWDGNRQKE